MMLSQKHCRNISKTFKFMVSYLTSCIYIFLFPDIRVQLNDQLKNLDGRVEIQQGIVSEFNDIFRRRAEIESNYSKELDKLAKLITNRHKEHKQRYVLFYSNCIAKKKIMSFILAILMP